MRSNTTVIAALALQRGDADAMICGLEGAYMRHLRYVRQIIGLAPGVRDYSALSLALTSKGAYFICDTQVKPDPCAGGDRGNGDPRRRTRAPLWYRS